MSYPPPGQKTALSRGGPQEAASDPAAGRGEDAHRHAGDGDGCGRPPRTAAPLGHPAPATRPRAHRVHEHGDARDHAHPRRLCREPAPASRRPVNPRCGAALGTAAEARSADGAAPAGMSQATTRAATAPGPVPDGRRVRGLRGDAGTGRLPHHE
ncbi:hypothetical protein J2X68_007768 [Streptomyces sp. 3330]|nr:hypothetical protein [Streptomyces sp. 3330]